MLRDDIKKSLIEAMKSKNEAKTGTIRLINSAIKDKDIEARPKGNPNGIDDAAILSLLQSMVKQRRESIDMYKQGNRPDLVTKEQAEIDIISAFLPKQLSTDEVKTKIQEIIKSTGAASIKDMGKVMAELKTKYAGQIDMAAAGAMIKQMLGQ